MRAAKPAVVGGFSLGALVLVVAGVLFFGGTRFFERTARAVIFFQGSVAGLEIGAPVTFRGVRVGSVQNVEIHLSAGGESRIPVTIELLPGRVILEDKEARLQQLVAAGLRAQLDLQSFVTGQLRVNLDFRPGSSADMVKPTRAG
ncbi:MAG: MCE family protein [Acetobacteraceae bacterium]|nr:MCE family protein [Acetobacteraceae bacterium]